MVLLMQQMVQHMDCRLDYVLVASSTQFRFSTAPRVGGPPTISAPKSPSSLTAYFGVKEGWPVPLHKEWRMQFSELVMRSHS